MSMSGEVDDPRILSADDFASHLRGVVIAALRGDRPDEAEASLLLHVHDEALRARLADTEAERDAMAEALAALAGFGMVSRAEAAEARVEELAAELDAIPPHKRAWRFDVQRLEARVEALTEALTWALERVPWPQPRGYKDDSYLRERERFLAARRTLGVPVVPQEGVADMQRVCPTCGSTDPKDTRPLDCGGDVYECQDAWHVSPKEGERK